MVLPPDQFLMVMGGYNGIALDDVELVSLNENLPVPACLLNFRSLPEARHQTAASLFGKGMTNRPEYT